MGTPARTPTQQYTDELELEELEDALDRAASRDAQSSPELETIEPEVTAALEAIE